MLRRSVVQATARRASSTHAISKPTLANIEKRWESMPLQEQAELWMSLRERMKENWNELTLHEKKAGECAHNCAPGNSHPRSHEFFHSECLNQFRVH